MPGEYSRLKRHVQTVSVHQAIKVSRSAGIERSLPPTLKAAARSLQRGVALPV